MVRSNLLRTTYSINAAATMASGIALLVGGHLLAPRFGVPMMAVWGMGLFFVVFAAWVWSISRRAELRWSEAVVAALLDGAYALASVAMLLEFGSRLTLELRVTIALLAAPVAVFAVLEMSGARRLRSAMVTA
jgi:hypothetical protein